MKLKRVKKVIEILSLRHDSDNLRVMGKIHQKDTLQVSGLNSVSSNEIIELYEQGFLTIIHSTVGEEDELNGFIKAHIIDMLNS